MARATTTYVRMRRKRREKTAITSNICLLYINCCWLVEYNTSHNGCEEHTVGQRLRLWLWWWHILMATSVCLYFGSYRGSSHTGWDSPSVADFYIDVKCSIQLYEIFFTHSQLQYIIIYVLCQRKGRTSQKFLPQKVCGTFSQCQWYFLYI